MDGVSDGALHLLLSRGAAAYRAVVQERDELRAVLAPLLDDPIRYPDTEQYDAECVFCDDYRSLPEHHAPDCPVLRRDALLGR